MIIENVQLSVYELPAVNVQNDWQGESVFWLANQKKHTNKSYFAISKVSA